MATPQRRRIIGSGYEHDYNPELCRDDQCEPIEVKPKYDPPEFIIEISYEDYANPIGIFQTGWKYNLRWVNDLGMAKVAYEYGWASAQDARDAAEVRAKRVTLAAMPTETYKYKHFPDIKGLND